MTRQPFKLDLFIKLMEDYFSPVHTSGAPITEKDWDIIRWGAVLWCVIVIVCLFLRLLVSTEHLQHTWLKPLSAILFIIFTLVYTNYVYLHVKTKGKLKIIIRKYVSLLVVAVFAFFWIV